MEVDEVRTEAGLEYVDGQLLDVHRRADVHDAATVLLWHGRGPDERDVLAPLARAAAAEGLVVVVPDWRSDAEDGGRAQLLASIAWTRRHAGAHGGHAERILLAGWSLGARAAAGVVLHPEVVEGWRPQALVGLAGSYGAPAPSTGRAPLGDPRVDGRSGTARIPVHLVHGARDEVAAPRGSRDLRDRLAARGWSVALDEPETDHAGIIGARYDPGSRRCVPDDGACARTGLEAAVRALVAATLPDEHLGIRRLLALSPEERLRSLATSAAFFAAARRAG